MAKEKDSVKVESYSVEFYEKGDLDNTLRRIIAETNGDRCQIHINTSKELFNYFEAFSGLSDKDIKDSINLEFDSLCGQKGYNRKSLETRYLLMNSQENPDKYKVLHIAVNKNDITNITKDFTPNRITSMTPISTTITNLLDVDDGDNAIIVNIEDETEITTVVEGQIYRANIISDGMGKILSAIKETESTTKKAYEVCKNTTVYSQQGGTMDGNEYINEVTTVLDSIINETKEIIDSTFVNIKRIYITGSGSVINNIDLYFQQFIPGAQVEILKPFFMQTASLKVPLKDYIEVNSAIALALNGVDKNLKKELNFVQKQPVEVNIMGTLKDKLKFLNKGKGEKTQTAEIEISSFEKLFMRLCLVVLVLLIAYVIFSNTIVNRINEKIKEVTDAQAKTQAQIEIMNEDRKQINDAAATYSILLENLKKLSEDVNSQENNRIIAKDAIPNLLNKVMFVMPKDMKLDSITNEEGTTHIVIVAEAKEYEQLGYFMAAIKTGELLQNVKSTSGIKTESMIKITIEGDLP